MWRLVKGLEKVALCSTVKPEQLEMKIRIHRRIDFVE